MHTLKAPLVLAITILFTTDVSGQKQNDRPWHVTSSAFIEQPNLTTRESLKKERNPKPVSLLFGYHQWNTGAGEIGISNSGIKGKFYSMRGGAERSWAKANAFSLSTEFTFNPELIIAPKLSYWYRNLNMGPLTLGGSILCYTDFENAAPVLRPEIGFALVTLAKHHAMHTPWEYNMKLSAGYNYSWVSDSGLPFVNTPVISLIFYKEPNVLYAQVLH